jgi:hypothetical protein
MEAKGRKEGGKGRRRAEKNKKETEREEVVIYVREGRRRKGEREIERVGWSGCVWSE